MGVKKPLRRALADREFVRLEGVSFDAADGFVVGMGKEWVLLAATLDAGYFNGYQALRIADITRVTAREAHFGAAHARTQPEWPPKAPKGIDLDDTVGLLISLGTRYPIIGIERGRIAREARWIGRLDSAKRTWTYLHEVGPDATWRDTPLGHRTDTITSVVVDDLYQRALASVAGAEADRSAG